jgi:2-dehydro-3-deoxygluconokinase
MPELRAREQPGPRDRVDVVTAGETMLCLSPYAASAFSGTDLCRRGYGGAESNTAIALARLGVATAWFSRVGADPFGDELLVTLAHEGVHTAGVLRDPDRQTGVMFKERPTVHESRVRYYRAGSAACQLGSGDVAGLPLDGARLLHLTGITCALGSGPREFVTGAMERARAAGLTVTFDPNYRPALWSPAAARAEYRRLLPLVDQLLLNESEAALIVDETDPVAAARRLQGAGPRVVVLKRGREGAVAAADDLVLSVGAYPVTAIDSVGAGDAFNAGWIYGQIQHRPPADALPVAAWVAARVAAHAGDYEGAPVREELERFEPSAVQVGP